MKRGEVWWSSVPVPTGSGPGMRRSVPVVQSNPFNQSRIVTVDRELLTEPVRVLSAVCMRDIDSGLRLVLSL
jgi:mRNA interferase MazF